MSTPNEEADIYHACMHKALIETKHEQRSRYTCINCSIIILLFSCTISCTRGHAGIISTYAWLHPSRHLPHNTEINYKVNDRDVPFLAVLKTLFGAASIIIRNSEWPPGEFCE